MSCLLQIGQCLNETVTMKIFCLQFFLQLFLQFIICARFCLVSKKLFEFKLKIFIDQVFFQEHWQIFANRMGVSNKLNIYFKRNSTFFASSKLTYLITYFKKYFKHSTAWTSSNICTLLIRVMQSSISFISIDFLNSVSISLKFEITLNKNIFSHKYFNFKIMHLLWWNKMIQFFYAIYDDFSMLNCVVYNAFINNFF